MAQTPAAAGDFVLKPDELRSIVDKACSEVLPNQHYDSEEVEQWNGAVIRKVLLALKEASPPSKYKFIVTSVIIQHDSLSTSVANNARPPAEQGTSGGEDSLPFAQRGGQGFHSATGSFWDEERDGTWSYRFEGAGLRGYDAVVSVIWVSTYAG